MDTTRTEGPAPSATCRVGPAAGREGISVRPVRQGGDWRLGSAIRSVRRVSWVLSVRDGEGV